MQFKGMYADKSAWFQLFLLLIFALTGTIIATIIITGSFFAIYGFSADIFQYPHFLRLLQFLSAIGMFLLPAIGVAWLCSHSTARYLSVRKSPKLLGYLLAFVCLLLAMPAINLMEILNRQMVFPDFLAPVEEWMRLREDEAMRMTLLFLADSDVLSVLANLLVIALTAAVTEEFLFRGALQRIVGKWTTNPHVVIWIVAIVFSAIHMQFYGFIPRMLLGAFFGYLLLWSESIWVPVFVHFMNNALAVITLSSSSLKENAYMTGELTNQEILPYSIVAIVLLGLFVYMLKPLRKALH